MVWILGRGGEAGVTALGDLLKDSDDQIRWQAMQVLRNLGPKESAKALPAVKDACKDANRNVRTFAMYHVAQSGGDGANYLVKSFSEFKDGAGRADVIRALASLGERKHLQGLLKSAMKDDTAEVRMSAIHYLHVFGNSTEAFEAFSLGIKDADPNVRISAANQAQQFGKKSWDPLEEALKAAKDLGTRLAVAQGMQQTTYRGKASVRSLTDCLGDSNGALRHLACNVLGNIGPDAADALPALRKLADDGSNIDVQQAARNAVKRIDVKR
jgi:HEAT repeat protein